MKDEGGFFVRTLRWYFILREIAPPELYAVGSDPEQLRNVAGEHPGVVRELTAEIRVWEARTRRVPRGWRPVFLADPGPDEPSAELYLTE